MRNQLYSTRPSIGRKALVGLLAAGVAATVLYSVAGSARMVHDDDDDRRRVTQQRDVTGFTDIQVKGAIDLELTAGRDFSVTVRTRGNRIDDVTTEVRGKTLIIDMEDGRRNFWNNSSVEVTITMPELAELEVLGAVDGELHDIKSDALTIDVRGAADVEIRGTCGTLTLDVKGAGDIDAEDLKCSNVDVDVRGAGSASVYASESIDANVSGVASISVYGDPKDVRKQSGGLSSISIR